MRTHVFGDRPFGDAEGVPRFELTVHRAGEGPANKTQTTRD